MATTTTNLVLRKPDTTDLINVTTDLNQNFDLVDGLFDAWTAYTPAWTSAGTAPALGNGTLIGRYRKMGKILDFRLLLTLGTTSTLGTGAWFFSLPATMAAAATPDQLCSVLCNLAALFYTGIATIAPAATVISPRCYAGGAGGALSLASGTIPTGTWAANDRLILSGRFELA